MQPERPNPLGWQAVRRNGVRTMTFDETNAKILALLQRDSSLTNEAIGSEVNLSSTAVIKRVKKLRDSGVIEATVAVLSLQSAGPLVSALVLCSFDPDGAGTVDQFAQTLLLSPRDVSDTN